MGVAALQVLMAVWAVSETILLLRTRAHGGASRQGRRGSVWIVWTVIALSFTGAMAAQLTDAPRIPLPMDVRVWGGIGVMVAGLLLRFWAVATLGRFFSVDVAIQTDHEVVRRGPYRYLRHPSYTGMIMAFGGIGIALGNWLSLALAVIPTTAVILFRVRVEERAMVQEFGDGYLLYQKETRRLFPGLY